MNRLVNLSVGLSLFLIGFSLPASAYEIGAKASYWFPSFKSEMKADNNGSIGSTIDLKDNLGIENESFPIIEAFGAIGEHHLGLAYTPIEYSDTARITIPLTFNGETFAAGSSVNSDLKVRMLDVEYQYTFYSRESEKESIDSTVVLPSPSAAIPGKIVTASPKKVSRLKKIMTQKLLGGSSLFAIGQIKLLDGEAKLVAPAEHTSAEHSFRLPVPMIGVGGHLGLFDDILEARGKITGIAYPDNYIYEASADLSWTPIRSWDISAGYRIIRMKLDSDNFILDSQFNGPYLGVSVSF